MRKLLRVVTTTLIVLVCLLFSGIPAQAAPIELAEGAYDVSVALEGGTGRAFVESPTTLVVDEEGAKITLTWSSPNYDYMIVDGERFLPTNESGNSVFEIPAEVTDEPIAVVADTTAMSEPHEIAYTLTIEGASVQAKGSGTSLPLVAGVVLAVGAVAAVMLLRRRAA